jgi:hypothetical protein
MGYIAYQQTSVHSIMSQYIAQFGRIPVDGEKLLAQLIIFGKDFPQVAWLSNQVLIVTDVS